MKKFFTHTTLVVLHFLVEDSAQIQETSISSSSCKENVFDWVELWWSSSRSLYTQAYLVHAKHLWWCVFAKVVNDFRKNAPSYMFHRVLNTPRLSRFILIIKSPHFLHRDIRNVLEKTPKCLAIFDSCHSDDVTKVWVNAVVTRRNVIISQRCICSLKNIIAVLALKGWDDFFYDKEPVDVLCKLFVIEATD